MPKILGWKSDKDGFRPFIFLLSSFQPDLWGQNLMKSKKDGNPAIARKFKIRNPLKKSDIPDNQESSEIPALPGEAETSLESLSLLYHQQGLPPSRFCQYRKASWYRQKMIAATPPERECGRFGFMNSTTIRQRGNNISVGFFVCYHYFQLKIHGPHSSQI